MAVEDAYGAKQWREVDNRDGGSGDEAAYRQEQFLTHRFWEQPAVNCVFDHGLTNARVKTVPKRLLNAEMPTISYRSCRR